MTTTRSKWSACVLALACVLAWSGSAGAINGRFNKRGMDRRAFLQVLMVGTAAVMAGCLPHGAQIVDPHAPPRPFQKTRNHLAERLFSQHSGLRVSEVKAIQKYFQKQKFYALSEAEYAIREVAIKARQAKGEKPSLIGSLGPEDFANKQDLDPSKRMPIQKLQTSVHDAVLQLAAADGNAAKHLDKVTDVAIVKTVPGDVAIPHWVTSLRFATNNLTRWNSEAAGKMRAVLLLAPAHQRFLNEIDPAAKELVGQEDLHFALQVLGRAYEMGNHFPDAYMNMNKATRATRVLGKYGQLGDTLVSLQEAGNDPGSQLSALHAEGLERLQVPAHLVPYLKALVLTHPGQTKDGQQLVASERTHRLIQGTRYDPSLKTDRFISTTQLNELNAPYITAAQLLADRSGRTPYQVYLNTPYADLLANHPEIVNGVNAELFREIDALTKLPAFAVRD